MRNTYISNQMQWLAFVCGYVYSSGEADMYAFEMVAEMATLSSSYGSGEAFDLLK